MAPECRAKGLILTQYLHFKMPSHPILTQLHLSWKIPVTDKSFSRADSPRTSTLLLQSHQLPAVTHGWDSTGRMTEVTERVAPESPFRHFHKGETLDCRTLSPWCRVDQHQGQRTSVLHALRMASTSLLSWGEGPFATEM